MTAQTGISPQRRRQIECRVRYLQLELWNRRHQLWGTSVPSHPMGVLDPGVALNAKGYMIESTLSPGEYWDQGRRVEVAGTIDRAQRVVTISSRGSQEVQLFTAAHELGHAILHPSGEPIHRDRAISGPTVRRDRQEVEADYFASCFLMPEKPVRRQFQENFLTELFALTDDTAFALCTTSHENALRSLRCRRDLSRVLATAISYGGRPIRALTSAFCVSPAAMAIRLEELALVSA